MIIDDVNEALSLKEAALLAGVTEKTIRHEVAQHVARPRRRNGRLVFGPRDVVFFRLIAGLPFEVEKGDRKDLFEVIAGNKEHKGIWRLASSRLVLEGSIPTELRLADLLAEVASVFSSFVKGKRRVVCDSAILGGEPVFAGTRVSIRHVGALVKRGINRAELSEDFPALRDADFDFALMFLELGRPPGRPRKLKFIR